VICLKFSSVLPDSDDWETYLLDLLFSVQSRRRVFDSLFRYFPSLLVSDVQSVLSSLRRVEYSGMSFTYRSVYTDCLKDDVLFLSSKSVDRYHEKLVSHLTSVSVLSGLSFKRRPSRSRYDGYDLELRGLNVEVETGLKASYRDLEDRIALSSYPVLVVVPNQDVLKRYSNHFRFWDVHLTSLSGYLGSVGSVVL
jgi:hypothetical protein